MFRKQPAPMSAESARLVRRDRQRASSSIRSADTLEKPDRLFLALEVLAGVFLVFVGFGFLLLVLFAIATMGPGYKRTGWDQILLVVAGFVALGTPVGVWRRLHRLDRARTSSPRRL